MCIRDSQYDYRGQSRKGDLSGRKAGNRRKSFKREGEKICAGKNADDRFQTDTAADSHAVFTGAGHGGARDDADVKNKYK